MRGLDRRALLDGATRGRRDRDERPTPPTALSRRHVATGALLGLAALIAYLPGLGRPWGWDESITIHTFVATPSLLDPFRREVEYNNHPLLSFADHLIYSITGNSSEVVMRLVPLLSVVLAVALLTTLCHRRFGIVPGIAAGVLMSANPLVIEAARTARGYGLLLLCTVASSALLLEALHASRPTRLLALYAVTVALGIAAHPYMAFVVATQAAYVLASHARVGPWLLAWVGGVTAGAMAYVGVVAAVLASPQRGDLDIRALDDVGVALLGSAAAAVVLLPMVVLGVHQLREQRPALAAIATAGGLVVADIIVLHPAYVYPRFFVWAVPGICAVVAAGVQRWPRAIALPCAAAALTTATVVPGYLKGDVGSRAAAAIVVAAESRGATVCVDSPAPLEAYVDPVPAQATAANLATCAVVVLLYTPSEAGRQAAAHNRPIVAHLDARTDGTVYSKIPLPDQT